MCSLNVQRDIYVMISEREIKEFLSSHNPVSIIDEQKLYYKSIMNE